MKTLNDVLEWAADLNLLGMAKKAVEAGADPGFDNDEALSCAAQHNSLGVAEYLMSRGCSPSNQSSMPLITAAGNGHLEMVRLLIEKEPESFTESISIALRWAVTNNHLEVARYLISRGADLEDIGVVYFSNLTSDMAQFIKENQSDRQPVITY